MIQTPNTAWSPYPIGRVSVGRVSVGRVSVGRVSVGRVSVGRVSVGPSDAWVAWWEAYRAYRYANLRAFRALLGLRTP